jgi:hypothetical protein
MTTAATETEDSARTSSGKRLGPVVTLVLLAPILSELLSGSTRVTTLLVLIPSTGVWGCAALIIRELAARRGRTWRSVLILGVALAVSEECLIQQTSLAPLITIDPERVYGRAFGVNWEYFLWALGFESVWAVALPIGLTEYLFPARRNEPWLGTRGLVIATVVFVLASFVAWYSWTQIFVPKFFPKSIYHPPAFSLVLAFVSIAVLAALALAPHREIGKLWSESDRPAPRPWVVGLVSFGMALPWYLQVLLAFGALPRFPAGIALLSGLVLAAVALILSNRWSARRAWGEAHSLATIVGILIATLIGGSVVLCISRASRIDRFGQLVSNLAALGSLILHAQGRRCVQPQHQERA